MTPAAGAAMAGDPEHERIERAYFEYRRAGYGLIERHAEQRGVLAALAEPRTPAQLGETLGVLPSRAETFELFLAALARHGTIARDGDCYRVARGADPAPAYDESLIAAAIGHDKVDSLIEGDAYLGILDELTTQANPVSFPFTNDHLALWDEFVQMPFYARFRREAARLASIPGGRTLDLASGLGQGLHEHLEVVGRDGRILGVETSKDFVHHLIDRTAGDPQISICQGDLEEGLWFVRDAAFDTVTLVGAHYFIERRDELVAEARRVLRRGGRFCLACTYESRGTYDQELADLRFSMREPAKPTTEADIRRVAKEASFELETTWHLGCFGFYVFLAA